MISRIHRAYQWMLKDALRQNLCALAVIIFVVLLGNVVYVSGLKNPDPLIQYSGLGTNVTTPLIKGTYTIDPNIGFTTQALGGAAAHQLLHGHMPYWNYDEGVGSPLAGEMQSAAFFPTTLLLALTGGVLLEHLVLEIIAGYFTYLFIRRLGLQARAALLGGVMFALNGTFAWLGNAAFNPIAFLPVMLYGLEALVQNKKTKTWLWLPIGLALSLYAGFPETAFIDALLVVLWTLARLYQQWSGVTRKQLLKICFGLVLGIILATPILVLFLDYLPNANVGGHAGIFVHASLSIVALPMHIFPYVYGAVAGFSQYDPTGTIGSVWGSIGGYVDITVVFFATIGIFSRMNIKLKGVLIFWISLCLLKMFGFRPAEDIWNLIPTIKNAAFFRYCTPSIYFAGTILAAYGLQSVLTRTISRVRLAYGYIAFGVMFVAVALLARRELWHVASAPHHKLFAVGSILWAGMVTGLLATAIIVVKRKYLYPIIFLIVLTDVVLMFIVPTLSALSGTVDKTPVQFLQNNLGTSRFYSLSPIAPNYGSYFGIAEVDSNDLPIPTLWTNYFTKQLDTNADPILFTGFSRVNPNGPSSFAEFLQNEKNYEYIGTKFIVTAHNQLTTNQISDADLTLKSSSASADIYQLPYTAPFYQAIGGCTVAGGATLASAKVNCASTGSVIRRELYMPGWRVNVDGKTTGVNEHGKLFQSVKLGKGTHHLRFNFSPPHIVLAWLAFFVGAITVLYSLLSQKIRGHIQVILKQLWLKTQAARN